MLMLTQLKALRPCLAREAVPASRCRRLWRKFLRALMQALAAPHT